jgi:hypothetical protein
MSAEPETTTPRRHRKPSEWVHPISFRVNDDQYMVAESLRATFDPPTHTEAFRWFLCSDEGRELIAKRVRGEI